MTNSLWMIFHVSKGEKLGRGKTFGTLGSIRVGGIYVERSFNANSKKFLEGQFFLWRLRNPPCALVLRCWVFSNPFCAKLEWFKTSRIRWSCNEPKDIPWLWSNRYPLPRPSCYEPKEIPCPGSIGGFSLHPDTRALMSHGPADCAKSLVSRVDQDDLDQYSSTIFDQPIHVCIFWTEHWKG